MGQAPGCSGLQQRCLAACPACPALPRAELVTLTRTCPARCAPLPRSVRMQKLEAIKEARAAGSKRQVGEVDAAAAAAAEELIEPEVERPVIQLPKKRRVADSMAALAAGGGSSSEDEGDAEQGLLDWRAKTSAF